MYPFDKQGPRGTRGPLLLSRAGRIAGDGNDGRGVMPMLRTPIGVIASPTGQQSQLFQLSFILMVRRYLTSHVLCAIHVNTETRRAIHANAENTQREAR